MEIVECPVCMEVFKSPKILPTCFHTLCEACAMSMCRNKTINCPLCRKDNTITTELAPNYILQQLLDSKICVSKAKIFCESDDGNAATSWCKTCDYNCCEKCWIEIHKIGKFKTHEKQAVDQHRSKNKAPMCHSHQNYSCDFYCKTCAAIICNICWVDSHKSACHEVCSIYSCAEEIRENLLESLAANFSHEMSKTNASLNQLESLVRQNELAIAQKQQEIDNLKNGNETNRQMIQGKKDILEQSNANQELLKDLILLQQPANLLRIPTLAMLEGQISDIFTSLFHTEFLKTAASRISPEGEKLQPEHVVNMAEPSTSLAPTNMESTPQPFYLPTQTLPSYSGEEQLFSNPFSIYLDAGEPRPEPATVRNEKENQVVPPLIKEEENYDARLVKDVKVPDGSEFAPAQKFTKVWLMKNVSKFPWPEDTKIMWVAGDTLNGIAQFSMKVKSALPNEEVEIAMQLQAPVRPGRYVSYYRLVAPSTKRFGNRIWADIVVNERLVVQAVDEQPSPLSPAISALTISDSEYVFDEETDVIPLEYRDGVLALKQMGFSNCLAVLCRFDGNVNAALEYLLNC